MPDILVTGGTGTVGRHVVDRLAASGYDVRVLTRRAVPASSAGVRQMVGDVRSGPDVERAASGVDAIVHLATSPAWRPVSTETLGMRNVVAAAQVTRAHVVYLSIVGTDRVRFPYYRAKLAAEEILTTSTVPWTLCRSTQFHAGLDHFLGARLWPATPNQRFQPIDETEVAAHLAELVAGGPRGCTAELGGPEVLALREVVEQRRRIAGRRTVLIRAPPISALRELDAGALLAPDRRVGTITWAAWLARAGVRPSRDRVATSSREQRPQGATVSSSSPGASRKTPSLETSGTPSRSAVAADRWIASTFRLADHVNSGRRRGRRQPPPE